MGKIAITCDLWMSPTTQRIKTRAILHRPPPPRVEIDGDYSANQNSDRPTYAVHLDARQKIGHDGEHAQIPSDAPPPYQLLEGAIYLIYNELPCSSPRNLRIHVFQTCFAFPSLFSIEHRVIRMGVWEEYVFHTFALETRLLFHPSKS